MSEIDKIISDKPTKMTQKFQRAFLKEACDPACHCCEVKIPIGDIFKLADVGGKDEMLCGDCTVLDLKLIIAEKANKNTVQEYHSSPYRYLSSGGYTRAHRE